MKVVFKISREKLKEVKKILESNPYEEGSFAKIGYTLKEGKVLGEDENSYYLYLETTEENIKKAEEKLSGLAEKLGGEEAERVIKKIEEEHDSAISGFGAMFG